MKMPRPDAGEKLLGWSRRSRASHSGRRALRAEGVTTDQAIYDRLVSAIMTHRLPPGTKLGEDRLAAIFDVNRSRIRQVLAWLKHEQIVTIYPNRGAFVSKPTRERAREVFDVRRVVEPVLIARLVKAKTRANIERLRKHVAAEDRARADNDRRTLIRLSGEFHLVIAEMVGNSLLVKMMRELISHTFLIIALYDSPTVSACRNSEHADILDAINSGDTDKAVRAILKHLDHIESCLELGNEPPEILDLEAALS
jgi:DNA-binding GntR family transcriptional regulator